jgi:phosphoribosylanthranilate isomerase
MAVRVKICGITNVEDALAAARFAADYVGLNFYPGSSRCISEGQARLILDALPKNTTPVALFVNEPWNRIGDVVSRLGITMVQIHADEHVPCPLPNLSWVPAFPIRDSASLSAIQMPSLPSRADTSSSNSPAAILVDAHIPGAYGGTGKRAPWALLADMPIPLRNVKLMLAGGLTPDNVAEAIRIVRPWAVDVAGGVESSPGKKDHDKMRRFIENARAADA